MHSIYDFTTELRLSAECQLLYIMFSAETWCMLNRVYCVLFSVDTSTVCSVVNGRRPMRTGFVSTFLMTTLLKTVRMLAVCLSLFCLSE